MAAEHVGADALHAEADQDERRRQEDRDHTAAQQRQEAGDDPRGLHDGLGGARPVEELADAELEAEAAHADKWGDYSPRLQQRQAACETELRRRKDSAATRREPPQQAFLAYTFEGDAYPLPVPVFPAGRRIDAERISGAFGACFFGGGGAILDNGEGKRWIVFDLDSLKAA
jgi:hypothetical protein